FILLNIPVFYYLWREIKKSLQFFEDLTARYLGRTTKIPLGTVFAVAEGVEARVFALQGVLHYEARINLTQNPGVLIVRRFKFLKMMPGLDYSPGRSRVVFEDPVDDFYSFQGKNAEWIREVFDRRIRERLRMEGRIARMEVNHQRFLGRIMLWKFTPKEQALAYESVDLLNTILSRVLTSSLSAAP
ncbi:MAG: hypothetical protein K8I00_11070, partial [Candidatus Omnitrophica bacterium]|nr:hypothetical protein [Candidatus Omnitrophota bacterium]